MPEGTKDVIREDLERIALDGAVSWEKLNGKTILITGATGLIGRTLVPALQYKNRRDSLNCRILILTRDRQKAERLFGEPSEELGIYPGDVMEKPVVREPVDYIVHGASVTSSEAFVKRPVETIRTAVYGTENFLRLAQEKQVKGFVYLSSMEVYGTPKTDEKIREDHSAEDMDPTVVRNCYPESKRMCESLCCSYWKEYQVPARILRLTQTFGPGVEDGDRRVFAEFARCVIEARDLVLHTAGETKRSYLYTADAAAAILTVLLDGKNGEAYNAANEETYCSILQMARMVSEKFGEGKTKVQIQIPENAETFGYAPTLHMNLDTEKLRSLGWRPQYSLEESFARMLADRKAGRETK